MSRKDYRLLAQALKEQLRLVEGPQELKGFARAVGVMSAVLAVDNPNFDHDRFYEAVGFDEAERRLL